MHLFACGLLKITDESFMLIASAVCKLQAVKFFPFTESVYSARLRSSLHEKLFFHKTIIDINLQTEARSSLALLCTEK